jgi:hypothetical protein
VCVSAFCMFGHCGYVATDHVMGFSSNQVGGERVEKHACLVWSLSCINECCLFGKSPWHGLQQRASRCVPSFNLLKGQAGPFHVNVHVKKTIHSRQFYKYSLVLVPELTLRVSAVAAIAIWVCRLVWPSRS